MRLGMRETEWSITSSWYEHRIFEFVALNGEDISLTDMFCRTLSNEEL